MQDLVHPPASCFCLEAAHTLICCMRQRNLFPMRSKSALGFDLPILCPDHLLARHSAFLLYAPRFCKRILLDCKIHCFHLNVQSAKARPNLYLLLKEVGVIRWTLAFQASFPMHCFFSVLPWFRARTSLMTFEGTPVPTQALPTKSDRLRSWFPAWVGNRLRFSRKQPRTTGATDCFGQSRPHWWCQWNVDLCRRSGILGFSGCNACGGPTRPILLLTGDQHGVQLQVDSPGVCVCVAFGLPSSTHPQQLSLFVPNLQVLRIPCLNWWFGNFNPWFWLQSRPSANQSNSRGKVRTSHQPAEGSGVRPPRESAATGGFSAQKCPQTAC